MKSQLATYIEKGDLQFIFVDRPLSQQSLLPAEAAHCAADQDYFWAYHQYLMENQQRGRDAADMSRIAAQLGLDVDAFGQCLESGKHREAVMQSAQKASEMGINFTPFFMINGEPFRPQRDWHELVEAVKEVLSRQ